MDIISTVMEIGLLETSLVASRYPSSFSAVAAQFPAVNMDYVDTNIQRLVDIIIAEKNEAVFLMLPEIALLERLAATSWGGTAIIAIPFDLDEQSQARIFANMPDGVKTEFVHEGAYPMGFRPDNGLLICTGIVPEGHRQYVLPSCYRMMSLYKVFQGERMLYSCFPKETKIPEIGWTYTEHDFFTRMIDGGTT